MASPLSECQFHQENAPISLQACTRYLNTTEIQQRFPDLPISNEFGSWALVQFQVPKANYFLDLGIPDAYQLQIFEIHATELRTLLILNEDARFQARPVLNRSLLLPLSSQGTPQTILIHYRTHGKTPLFLRLFEQTRFAQGDTTSILFHGAVFGLLIFLAPVLIIAFQSAHNRHYRYYAGLVLCNLAFLTQVEGYNFQFLWPESPHWNRQAPGFIACCITFFHILFAIQFLQIRQRMTSLYLAHVGLLIAILCTALFHLITDLELFIGGMTSAYAVFAVYTAYRAIQIRIPAARFYFVGSIVQVSFVPGLLMFSITVFNPFPSLSVLSYPKLGYLAEMIFFTIAVGEQIRLFNQRQAEQRILRLAETEQLLKAEQEKLLAIERARQQQLQLASASHDIAQPLASLRFAVAALGQSKESKPIANHVEQTLNYAQNLLHELIVQSREAQSTEVSDQFELANVLQQLAREFEPQAHRKGLTLSIHSSTLFSQGSAHLLYRILSNLLSNAIRYTQKGRVIVGVRRRPQTIEIQVWDTGLGIPDHQYNRLIHAFQQGQTPDQGREGYGLGLFIVHTLCQQCGYQLSVHRVNKGGSGFCLNIPYTLNASIQPPRQNIHQFRQT
ncbi:sensor histidine kinase [Undibacterium fentianense]|uniref:histidine kinase n=1 Tax=Undibacterium fentianense TaxID=2828728 RepID=A0A941ICX0_9BURK|nr:sensor histidine kinase [Undibacterium fentianense]MBR7800659.1 sensor histidine kinase [Undibacterium fentianense]